MGISFHISSVREGTLFNVMQLLSLEKVTGSLNVRFGPNIPEVLIYFEAGNLTCAEFGDLLGDAVLDLLLCQEFAIKEMGFNHGRKKNIKEESIIKGAQHLSGVMLNISRDIDHCEARSLVYGSMAVRDKNMKADSLLEVFNQYEKWKPLLQAIPSDGDDKEAPLPHCVLLHRALRTGNLSYEAPLVSLKLLRELISIVQPLSETEAKNLKGYMRSLLPHPKATHITMERFQEFAGTIESIAQRRSEDLGNTARKSIQEMIRKAKEASSDTSTNIAKV